MDIDVGYPFASRLFSEDTTGTRLLRGDNVGHGRLRWDGVKRWPVDQLIPKGLLLRVGDVVLAMDRPWIESGLKWASVRADDTPCLLVQRVARLRARGPLIQEYLRCLIASRAFTDHVLGLQTGSTVPHISSEQIASFPIGELPPRATQHAIGMLSGALDDKIDSNGRIDDYAHSMISAEYVHATSTRPEAPLDCALELEVGSPFAGEHFNQSTQGRPLIRIRDLTTFRPQLWTTETRADEKVVTPGDVLVGMDAVFDSTFWRGRSGVLNQRVCRFVPKRGVSRAFALLAIRPDLKFFERAKSGTTVIHLNKADIDRFRVPLLTTQEHDRLAQATEPLVELLVQVSAESQTLAELRDALLPELLSSRLRFPQAQEIV